jgi:hypothetical protein
MPGQLAHLIAWRDKELTKLDFLLPRNILDLPTSPALLERYLKRCGAYLLMCHAVFEEFAEECFCVYALAKKPKAEKSYRANKILYNGVKKNNLNKLLQLAGLNVNALGIAHTDILLLDNYGENRGEWGHNHVKSVAVKMTRTAIEYKQETENIKLVMNNYASLLEAKF